MKKENTSRRVKSQRPSAPVRVLFRAGGTRPLPRARALPLGRRPLIEGRGDETALGVGKG